MARKTEKGGKIIKFHCRKSKKPRKHKIIENKKKFELN